MNTRICRQRLISVWSADYAGRLEKSLNPDLDLPSKLTAINHFLYRELGFSGNEQDYADPRNSYLNEVFDRKLGIPISLAVVQIEVMRRVGLALDGISFPGHFPGPAAGR